MLFAAAHESAIGTQRTWASALHMSAFWGNSGQVPAPWNFTGCMSALPPEQAAPLWQAVHAHVEAVTHI